jgi:hypothetical protein
VAAFDKVIEIEESYKIALTFAETACDNITFSAEISVLEKGKKTFYRQAINDRIE